MFYCAYGGSDRGDGGKKSDGEQRKERFAKGRRRADGVASRTWLKWSRKLGWLSNMLWGGALLLAFEHIWHGEVVPWPPFLTAIDNPVGVGPMLLEIATAAWAWRCS